MILKDKIDGLPENLKEQVADYVDFLLYRHEKSLLTAEEKMELNRRDAALRQGTLTSSSLEDVKARLDKKYGVSS